MKYWTLGMIAVNLLMTSCCPRLHECDFFTVAVPPPTPLCGHFEGNRFYDATGHFSVEIPESFRCDMVEQFFETSDTSMVIFQNDSGDLERVETLGIDEEIMSYFAESEHTWGAKLEAIFYTYPYSRICKKFKHTELLYIERVNEYSKDEGFFISVLRIPEGSNAYKERTNTFKDAFRSYLSFFDQKQLVILSCQEPFEKNNPSTHINWLLDLKTRYRNESKI